MTDASSSSSSSSPITPSQSSSSSATTTTTNGDNELVLTRVHPNGCAVVGLNRHRALNALNIEMISSVTRALEAWRHDERVRFVVIKKSGKTDSGRGFCAGGDIRALFDHPFQAHVFFQAEYRMDYALSCYPKPVVSFLDGITMGGGVGISVHGALRVLTDKTLFAMPETGIGLFPDVGGSYILSRCAGEVGMYLGITGQRLKAADAMYAGIGTHYVASSRVDAVIEALQSQSFAGSSRSFVAVEKALRAALDERCDALASDSGSLHKWRPFIDAAFSAPSLVQVEERLRAMAASTSHGDDDHKTHGSAQWAAKTLKTMSTKSPLSMHITFRAIRQGAKMSLRSVFELEYRIACRIGRARLDFQEGVSALLVRKDKKPKWAHSSISRVSAAEVDRYFAPFGEVQTDTADGQTLRPLFAKED